MKKPVVHFKTVGWLYEACGIHGYESTANPEWVTCKRCRKTNAWLRAMAAIVAHRMAELMSDDD